MQYSAHVSATSIVALTLPIVHAPRSERTYAAVQVSLAQMMGRFFITVISPHCHTLEFCECNFFVMVFFFRGVRVGDALYLAVAQIFILLIVWAQQR